MVDQTVLVGLPLVIVPTKLNVSEEQVAKSAPAFTVIFPEIFNTTVSETSFSQPLLVKVAVKRKTIGSPAIRSSLDGV